MTNISREQSDSLNQPTSELSSAGTPGIEIMDTVNGVPSTSANRFHLSFGKTVDINRRIDELCLTQRCIVCNREYRRHKGRGLTCDRPECRRAASSRTAELKLQWLKQVDELRADPLWEEHHGIFNKRGCRECGKPLYEITENHMRSHGTTFAESSKKYGHYSRHCRERMDIEAIKARKKREPGRRGPMTPAARLARGKKAHQTKEANRARTTGKELDAFRVDYRGTEKLHGITDYVVCLRCGAHVVKLWTHLKGIHPKKPLTNQYQKEFPGARIVPLSLNKRVAKARRNNPKWKEKSKERWAERKRTLAEAERLKNVEGLDLKTGIRVSLAACLSLEGANPYVMRNEIYPDAADSFDSVKKLFSSNRVSNIEAEKRRMAKLPEDQRRAEGDHLRRRLLDALGN
jgi:hypothetical protein